MELPSEFFANSPLPTRDRADPFILPPGSGLPRAPSAEQVLGFDMIYDICRPELSSDVMYYPTIS